MRFNHRSGQGLELKSSLKSFKTHLTAENIWYYACIALLLVYIAIARPSNTPRFFNNGFVKILVFVLVAFVLYNNLILGVLLGLAMVLTIAYAQSDTIEMVNENFTDSVLTQLENKITQSVNLKAQQEQQESFVAVHQEEATGAGHHPSSSPPPSSVRHESFTNYQHITPGIPSVSVSSTRAIEQSSRSTLETAPF